MVVFLLSWFLSVAVSITCLYGLYLMLRRCCHALAEKLAGPASVAGALPFPADRLYLRVVHFEVLLFFSPRVCSNPDELFARLCKGRFYRTEYVDRAGPFPAVIGHVVPTTNWPVLDRLTLSHVAEGLSGDRCAEAEAEQRVLMLDFVLESGPLYDSLQKACDLIAELAGKAGAVIWDQATRRCFTPRDWKSVRCDTWQRGVPNAAAHVSVHSYQDGSLLRVISRGMGKFGLPEIVVEACPPSMQEWVEQMVRLGAQTLVEQGGLNSDGRLLLDIEKIRHDLVRAEHLRLVGPGGTRKTELSLVLGRHRPEDGDPGLLMEIAFPEPGIDGPLSRRWEPLRRLYGFYACEGACDDSIESRAKIGYIRAGRGKGPETFRR